MSSLESHIDAVKSISLFEGTDFKLASSDYPLNGKVAHECGFTSLSIRIVKVTALSFFLYLFLDGFDKVKYMFIAIILLRNFESALAILYGQLAANVINYTLTYFDS